MPRANVEVFSYFCDKIRIMIKDTLNRYIWLVDTLAKAGEKGLTLQEISEKWEGNHEFSNGEGYPRRTFNNHRADLESVFGIIIDCNKSTNCYYISNRDELNNAKGFKKWLLDGISLRNVLNETESAKMHGRVLLEDVPSNSQFLPTIIGAMRENNTINILYQKFGDNLPCIHKNIQPYAIKIFKRRWYLLARNENEEFRIFALDRIHNVEVTDYSFELPDDFDAETFFSSFYGVFIPQDVEPQRVKIKVTSVQANYLRSLPIHHSQKEIQQTDRYSIFSFFVVITLDFIQELLTFSTHLEIIEPPTLRRQIKEIGKDLAKNNH